MSIPNFDYKQFENKQLPLYVRDPELKLKPGDSLPELSWLTDIKDDLPSIINLSKHY